jgi:nitrate/TMAO reductase-like tetraheme cytochrome c subunit
VATDDKSPIPGGGSAPAGGQPASSSAFSHWLSQLGMSLVLIAILAVVGLLVAGWVLPSPPVYMGLLFVVPMVLLLAGALLIPAGYFRERRRRTLGLAAPRTPPIVIDLTLSRHRTVLLLIGVGAIGALIVFTVGSFATFQAMDSNEFCGQACHKVMNPEFTAYQSAPHARVKCVECHIGAGVEWYLHAKLTGLRRLAAIVTGSYVMPIPTPIADMRPSREVCEECHWPGRFVGYKEKVHDYFTKGEDSPRQQLRLLLKIGGTESPFIKGFGIHYHMLGANKVEYVARDRQRQEIAWVRVTRKDGSSVEYNNEEFPVTAQERASLPVRRMECLDCHNRPAHEFKSPVDAVDAAMAAGTISRGLPFIKVRAVKALDGKYETNGAAMTGIADSLRGYYKENYPDVLTQKADLLNKTVADLQTIYKSNFFPEMKAKWSAYPNNIGHRDWPGCYRCHTDKMVSADGKQVFTDCTKCHLILAQGKAVNQAAAVNFARGEPFVHPGLSEQIKNYTKCVDCHTGGADLY